MENNVILSTEGLSKYFGGLAAVDDFNLSINQEEAVGLIGPNGAGKTTIFNLITGFLRPTRGEILFEGKDVVMRALELNRSIPVLVLARNSDMENYLEAMQLGAADYLEMPVAPEEFMRVLRTHLLYSLGRRTDA